MSGYSGKVVRRPGGALEWKDYGTVTQATSITTGVTLNKLAGAITTVSQTLAAGAEGTFTVTNSEVAATDVVVACLKSTSSAGGPFLVGVTAVAAGSFDITVTNTSDATAGNNTLVISFVVLKASS